MISSNHWILSTVRILNSRDAFQVGPDAPMRLLRILLWSQLNLCSNWMCDLRKLSLKKLGSQLQGPRWHLLLRCKIIFIVQELQFFNCLHYHHGTSNFCCCIRLKNVYFTLRLSNLYTGVVLPLHCNLIYLQELWSARVKSSWLNCGNKLIDPPLWKSYCTRLDVFTLAYHVGCTAWFAIRGGSQFDTSNKIMGRGMSIACIVQKPKNYASPIEHAQCSKFFFANESISIAPLKYIKKLWPHPWSN
jgi:hypothetical protein